LRAGRGLDAPDGAALNQLLNCDCMGPHAARQMAMVHGAEARGRYRVCESALTPTHTSSSPRSKTANTAAPSWTAARPYFPPASFLRMASSAALRAFSCSFWATEPCAHKHANPCQRGRARPSEAEHASCAESAAQQQSRMGTESHQPTVWATASDMTNGRASKAAEGYGRSRRGSGAGRCGSVACAKHAVHETANVRGLDRAACSA